MEITRLQPFPLTFTADGLSPNTNYVLALLDDHAVDLVEIPATSNASGAVSIELPDYFSRYDDEYRGEIYVKTGTNQDGSAIRGDLVWVDTITIMRPYVDPSTLAQTDEDINDAKVYESVARSIINSITGGFTYKREVYETTGLGADYLPIPLRLNKIIRVYENGVVVYDAEPTNPDWTNVREYYITPDKAAISVNVSTMYGINRHQSNPVGGRQGVSDSFTNYNTNDSPNFTEAVYDTKTFVDMTGNHSMFPNGWDYTVVVDAGWPVIPQDIKQATTMLVNDLRCNNLPYVNSYIKEYESDQFTIKLNEAAFKDTGNRIVDKILSAYVQTVYRLGVL